MCYQLLVTFDFIIKHNDQYIFKDANSKYTLSIFLKKNSVGFHIRIKMFP